MNFEFKRKWPLLFLIAFLVIFFRKAIFFGLLPVPSDLLVSWFFPFSSGGFENYSSWTTHKGLVADDAVRQQYPWKTFAASQWKKGEIPLWNPYAFAGYPQLANLQTGAFYPLNILFVLLDPKTAWTILVILQPLLSFLFMYLFLKSLNLNSVSAVFGSLVFIGMTFEILWSEQMIIGHTTLWLPLVLLSIQKIFEGRKKWFLLGIFGLTMSILAGYAQTTLYVFLISAFFFICKLLTGRAEVGTKRADFVPPRTLLVTGLIMFIIPLFLTAIQILPTLEVYQYSAREGIASQELFAKFLATPRHILTLFSSDIFGNVATENFWGDQYTDFNLFFGVTAFLIIVTALFLSFKNRSNLKEGKWFIILGIISLLLSFPPLGFISKFLNIPILSTGVPARFLFVFQFSACILSAFSLNLITRDDTGKFSFKPALIFVAVMALLTGAFLFLAKISNVADAKNYLVSSRNLIFATLIAGLAFCGLVLLKIRRLRTLALVLLLLLASSEYVYLANKYLPFAKKEYLFPDHVLMTFLKRNAGINRFWGGYPAKMGTNLPTYYNIYYPEGYDSLYIRRYGELVGAAGTGKIPAKIPRSDVNIDEKFIYKDKLLDLLGVKFILDKNDSPKSAFEPEEWKFPPDRYKLIWQEGKFKAYENLSAWPRIYFADKVIVKTKEQDIIDELYKIEHKNGLAVIEESLNKKIDQPQGEVKLERYTPNRIFLKTLNSKEGFLVLSDSYFPGWNAEVDGKLTKIYRTNYAFRGILVPEGKHEITFIYDPLSFKIGAIISLSGLIAISFFSIYICRKT